MPDDNTIIFVTLTPKSGKEADLEALLRGMCEPSRAEGGCIAYNLYKKADGGGAFHFFEVWKTQADLDAHRLEPHYKNSARSWAAWSMPPPRRISSSG